MSYICRLAPQRVNVLGLMGQSRTTYTRHEYCIRVIINIRHTAAVSRHNEYTCEVLWVSHELRIRVWTLHMRHRLYMSYSCRLCFSPQRVNVLSCMSHELCVRVMNIAYVSHTDYLSYSCRLSPQRVYVLGLFGVCQKRGRVFFA